MIPSRIILDPDSLPTEGRPWMFALGGLLVALLAFMPAAFGAVEAWSELVVIAIAAALSICLALWFLLGRNIRPVATWAWLPLLLFVLLVVCQLVPWPTAIVGWLSPSTLSTRQELLGSGSAADGQATISFYPLATAHGLRLLLVGVACFAVAANAFRNSRANQRCAGRNLCHRLRRSTARAGSNCDRRRERSTGSVPTPAMPRAVRS